MAKEKSVSSKFDGLFGPEDPTKLFELLEELAVGSYGTVYKAKHKPTSDIVALKIITLEEDETFDDLAIEISILKMCDHENIVRFYGGWKKGEELFIAMELCGGGAGNDLYQVLDKPVPEKVIAFVTRESLRGLEYLHSKNIIHRDIKASNILMTEDGRVKLTDFGVSACMQPGQKRRTFIGTPYWMAPEVTTGTYIPYDTKADIWSLGVTCLEMADLVPPNTHLAPMRAVLEIAKNPPPTLKYPEQWSKEFKDFLAQCLVKEPDRRKSAAELLKHAWFNGPLCGNKDDLMGLIRHVKAADKPVEEDAEEQTNPPTNGDDDAPSGTPKSGSFRGKESQGSNISELQSDGSARNDSPAPEINTGTMVVREDSDESSGKSTPAVATGTTPGDSPTNSDAGKSERAGSRPPERAPPGPPAAVRTGSGRMPPPAPSQYGDMKPDWKAAAPVLSPAKKPVGGKEVFPALNGSARRSQDPLSVGGSGHGAGCGSGSSNGTGSARHEAIDKTPSENSQDEMRRNLGTRRTLRQQRQQQNVMNEKRVVQQLKEMKKLQAAQLKEQEDLKEQHRLERENLANKYAAKAKTRDKTFKSNEKKLAEEQKDALESLISAHATSQKDAVSAHRDDFKKKQRELKDRLAKQEKEFTNQLKAKEANQVKALKANKTLDKRKVKEQELLVKEERLRDEQEFEYQLQRDEQMQLHKLAREFLAQEHAQQWEHLIQEHTVQSSALKVLHQMQRDNLLQGQQQENEQLGLDQQTERKNLLEEEVQQSEHQKQQHAQVSAQLQKHLLADHKKRSAAFKAEQDLKQKDWLKAQKAVEKQIEKSKDKKALAQHKAEAKRRRDAEIAAEQKKFQDMLAADRLTQETELKEEQMHQTAMLKELHAQMMRSLQREQANRELAAQQLQFKQQSDLQAEQFKSQSGVLNEQIQQQQALKQNQHKLATQLLAEQVKEQRNLQFNQQKAQLTLWQQHHGAQLETLTRRHLDQNQRAEKEQELKTQALQEEISKAEDSLHKHHEDLLTQLEATHAQTRKELEDSHGLLRSVLEQKLAPALA